MERLKDYTRELELQQRAAAFVQTALANDSSLCADRDEWMRVRGLARYVRKSGDVLVSGDPAIALQPSSSAFVAMVDARTVLGALDGALRVPVGAASGRLQVGEITATVTAEGDLMPIARMQFDTAGPLVKVTGGAVVSDEFARAIGAETQAAILAVVVASVAKATDEALIATLTAGAPAASADPGTLLALISGGRPARPCLIGGYDSLLGLAPGVVRDLEVLKIPVFACAAASGSLVALDQGGLLISDGGATVATAKHASLMLDTIGGSPTAPTLVSLWQNNLIALRATRLLRITAGPWAVAWASTGSPS